MHACKARAVDTERLFQFQQGHIFSTVQITTIFIKRQSSSLFLLGLIPALTWKQTS